MKHIKNKASGSKPVYMAGPKTNKGGSGAGKGSGHKKGHKRGY